MLALSGLGLAAWILPLLSEAPRPIPGPGRVVLAAEPRRDPGAVEPASSPARVVVVAAEADAGAASGATSALVAARAAGSDAADRALAEAIDAASSIELRGGTWLAWHQAGLDGRHERAWTQALRRAHVGGTEVRATGGAAAWIAGATVVPRAVLQKPAQEPHDTSLDLPVESLGLFEGTRGGVLVGVLEPGAPGADRVVERAASYGYRDVLLLAGAAEFAWDPAARRAVLHLPDGGPATAPAWAAWIDLGAGTRSRNVIRGARVTLPGDGDAFQLRERALEQAQTLDAQAWPASEPALAPLLDRLLGRFPGRGGPGGGAETPENGARLRNARAYRDERTARTPRGGLSAIALDFEFQSP